MTDRAHYISEEGPIRVLHVDDDACFLKTAKAILEMQGAFQVDTASSVEEAAGKMKTEKHDAIVCDYQMPEKDGLQFLKELRGKGNSIPFIIFTGKGREEVAIKALNFGADGYFNKSGYPETVYGELAHGIRQVVDKRRAEQSFLKSEDKYRRLVETLREGIWVIDKDSCTTFVNPRMAEMLGYNIEEMKGRHLFSFMDERGVEIAKRFLERRRQGIEEQHDFEFLRKDGTRIDVTLETSPITDDNGNYSGALASVMDITERRQAEKEVQIQREELTMILDCLPLQIWYKDKDNRLLRVNKRFAEYMGVSKRDLEGNSLSDLFPPDIARKCWEEDKEVIETGQSKIDILDHHESAQGLRCFLTSKVPCKDTDGKTIGTINFSFDITERKKTEENLKESEERYKQLIEFAPDPIFTYDLNGRLLDCNRQAEKLSGFKKEELLGKDIFTSARGRSLIKIVPGQRTEPAEYELVSKDGSKIDVEISTFPVNRKGKVEIIAIGRDIIERKKAEEALKNSEERWRSLAEGSPDHIMLLDLKFNILYINRTVPDLKREEVIGTSVFNYVPPELHRVVKDCLKRIIETSKTDHYDTEYRTKDGEVRYFDVRVGPVFQEERVVALISSSTDVTSQRKAEVELRNIKNYLDNLLSYANAPITVWNNAKRITLFNNAFEVLTGHKKESVLGSNIGILFPPSQKEEILQTIEGATKGEKWKSVEIPILCKDKKTKIALWNSANITDEEGKIVATIAQGQDITERKRVEVALGESEKKYRDLTETTSDFVWEMDFLGRYTYCSPQMEKLWGLKPTEMIGKTPFDMMPSGEKEKALEYFGVIGNSPKPFRLESTSYDDQGHLIFLEISGVPFFDDKGGLLGFRGISRDITERKKALEGLRVLNEKLGVVGKLTRHDVRNKLSAVIGNTYLAEKTLPNDHKASDYLRSIESACGEATRVLDFAAAYESLGVEGLTLMDMGKAVEEAVSLVSELKGVKIVNNCQGLTVMADSALSQLFFNLIDNSLKHGKNVSQIKIHYEEGKDRLKLFYEDDGVGIPRANKPKLFNWGFTTGNSSGYGLPLIKSMMEIYGWTIEEEGEQGKGAKFVITIPKTHTTMHAHNTHP